MGNGVPIAVTIAKSEIANSFKGMTFTTFGGNPVSTAAALAVIKEIEDKDLRMNAKVVGEYFRSKLEELKEKHEIVGDVRGMGLMQGIEIVKDKNSKEPAGGYVAQIFEETKKNRVLLGKGGLYGNVLRLGPPLIAEKTHVDEMIEALDKALNAVVK